MDHPEAHLAAMLAIPDTAAWNKVNKELRSPPCSPPRSGGGKVPPGLGLGLGILKSWRGPVRGPVASWASVLGQ